MTRYRHRRSDTAGVQPTALEHAEIAVNTVDGRLYYGRPNGTVAPVVAAADLPDIPTPSWHGLAAWTDDPALVTTSAKPTSGETRFGYARADAARANGAAVNFYLEVTAAASGLTYARCALYKLSAGVLTQVAITADQSTAWVSPLGIKTMPATLTAAINPGDELYFACLQVGTTTATFRQAGTSAVINVGTLKRRANLTGQSTLPATVNLSTLVVQQGCTFMALG